METAFPGHEWPCHALFGISKKAYNQAIRALYKAGRIAFKEGGTRLLDAAESIP